MVTTDKIKQVVEILRNIGSVQKNELIRHIVDKGLMSHFTASKAIDEAVESHRIFRQEEFRGKLKIVYFSINEDIQKEEERFKQEIENILNKYDEQFLVFEKKYQDLSIDEKADGLDALRNSFVIIEIIIAFFIGAYQETRYWTNLLKETKSRRKKFVKLSMSESEIDRTDISRLILSHSFENLKNAFEDVEIFLKKL